MSPGNRKAGQRRLADMSNHPVDQVWRPDLPPVEEHRDVFPISASVDYSLRYELDEYGRINDWAVVQRRVVNEVRQTVAVYDACHGKDVHVHLYNRDGIEFDQHPLHRPVRSYSELEDGMDYATERVVKDWLENERRSDRGK